MKKILLIFVSLLCLTATAQNQTFTGIKTFTSPPKFKNLANNNANTKVLTVNSNDVLQWRSASSFLTTPTLQQVTSAGNITDLAINVGTIPTGPLSTYQYSSIGTQGFASSSSDGFGNQFSFFNSTYGIEMNNRYGYYELVFPYQRFTTNSGTIRFPMPMDNNGDETLSTREWVGKNIQPYKVYKAYLSQSAANNPTPTVLINTLGDVVWTRTNAGQYDATLSNAFTDQKTFINVGNTSIGKSAYINHDTADNLILHTYNGSVNSDNCMANGDGQNLMITIEVYN